MKTTTFNTVFTRSIPADPEAETLYVSMEYQTAVHLCACGCGIKAVTPLGPHDWALTFDGTVSLHPSVGNGQQACRSHYYIRNDQIDWLPRISAAATNAALARDRAAHNQSPYAPNIPKSWWRRAWERVRRTG